MISLPWYVAGPLIGLMIPLVLILREKQLGVSSAFEYVGSLIFPKFSYFRYMNQKDAWQLHFVLGIFLSAIVLLSTESMETVAIDTSTVYGKESVEIYSASNWLLFLTGGFLVGFGARYADGCTAGHCIMGNALLTPSSLVTTISFFAGGLFVSHFVLPFIL